MHIDISEKLPGIPESEVRSMAVFLAKEKGTICVEASLVFVSGEPQDAENKATNRAALSMKFEGDPVEQRFLCYTYADGDSEALHSGGGPHLCCLYRLQPLDTEGGSQVE